MSSKAADLAGPGIGNYEELEKICPRIIPARSRAAKQKAIFAVKRFIEDNLCKELNLLMVTVPLLVDIESGVDDMLDRDGSRTPIQFHIRNDYDKHPVDAQIVRPPPSGRESPERIRRAPRRGLSWTCRAVRKDYFWTTPTAFMWTNGIRNTR